MNMFFDDLAADRTYVQLISPVCSIDFSVAYVGARSKAKHTEHETKNYQLLNPIRQFKFQPLFADWRFFNQPWHLDNSDMLKTGNSSFMAVSGGHFVQCKSQCMRDIPDIPVANCMAFAETNGGTASQSRLKYHLVMTNIAMV